MQHKTLSGVVIAVLVSVTFVAFGQAAGPDATLALSGGTAAAVIGYTWGGGTLTFRGQSYPFTVEGISFGTLGVTQVDVTAKVYNLKNLEDFNGTYAAMGAGVTVAGGRVAVMMRNQKGVEIYLAGVTQGLDLRLSVDGVTVALK